MTRTANRWPLAALVVIALLAAAVPALADPPSRVARLNYLKGSVSFRPATLDQWGPAALNEPLTTGDHLWTDAESWAELHVGSTAIRLAPETAFAILNLDDGAVQLRLSEGAIDVRVRNLDESEGFEIDTPSAAILLAEAGVYRVDVLPGGTDTRVSVRDGSVEVLSDNTSFRLHEGQAAAISGTDYVSHEVFRAGPPDDWERWCRLRDQREDESLSLRYVSSEMTGYEDLDDHGTWLSVPEYGWAWQPTSVAVGWAPYRHGRWRWVEPWGWTWIDNAAWGFAPFHYGRWTHLRGAWLWIPGAYVTRPVYAPALVAFIGGDRWGLSFGYHDALAWFPLAPRELWMPHYRASQTYIRNLNVTNVRVTNINIDKYRVSSGTYVNRAIRGAVTAVPRDAFLGGRAVPRHAIAVNGRAAMNGEVVGMSAPVAPRADSLVTRAAGVRRPSAAALGRSVVARTEPPAAPVPFQARERALQAEAGRPLDEAVVENLRRRTAGTPGSPVRLAAAGVRRGQPSPANATPDDDDALAGRAAPAYGGVGTATPRNGQWARPDTTEPAQPGRSTSGADTSRSGAGVNDRPMWARPTDGGAATTPTVRESWGSGQAQPRSGERVAPETRPMDPRPSAPAGARERWSGDRNQPNGGQGRSSEAGSRPPSSGGTESRPSAPAGARERSGGERSQPGAAAAPRSGDRPSSGAGVRGGGRESAPPPAQPPPAGRPPGGARERPKIGGDR